MIRVTVDDRNVQRMLSHLAARAQRPPVKEIQILAYRSILRNFHDQGRPERWKGLAEATRDARDAKTSRSSRGRAQLAKSGGQYSILQDTGALKKSIQAATVGKYNVTVYTKLHSKDGYYYPAVHQFGSKDGKVPARPFMLWQDEDVRMIKRLLINHLVNKAGAR